jgi:hypothetical protein
MLWQRPPFLQYSLENVERPNNSASALQRFHSMGPTPEGDNESPDSKWMVDQDREF